MRIPLLFPLLLPVVLAAAPATPPDPDEAAYPAIERFIEVLETVRQRHPDAAKLSYERLVNHALEGMLASLDPHSSFIHPEMAAAMKDGTSDPFLPSLGITLGLRDDGPWLAGVAPGGPAAKAGLAPGTALREIDGKSAAALTLAQLLERLNQAPGRSSKLLVKPPAATRPLEVTLVHIAVPDRAVTASKLLENTTPPAGLVRLAQFTDSAPRELEAALDELEDRGMKRLILDLRGNPGGSLPATVRILGLFLPPATEVVTTRGRNPLEDPPPLKTPERQRRIRDYPLAVLIDRDSASASELTAGALQDLKRATIIGETSYGKGSVQNIIPTGGGTALRLTIATYHTPSGRTPHLTGIQPDVKIPFSDTDRSNFTLSLQAEALTPDQQKILSSWTDPAIAAALNHR